MLVACVAAARPNFMKVKPVLDALERAGLETALIHTGQHYDAAMSDVFFDELGLRRPDHHLGVGSGSHAEQTAAVMVAFEQLIEAQKFDLTVVFGDVNSTVACALASAKSGARVAHVEAGLRSRDWDMPEEVNRVVTDRLSDVLFAPSDDAAVNLRAEGYRNDQIHVVGNVMIDTLLANLERARSRMAARTDVPSEFGVLTLHRPSNVDDPAQLGALLEALAPVAARAPLLFPVHPRTRRVVGEVSVPPGIELLDPQGYLDFVGLIDAARVVLTDSGGVQEETTALGVPCLTLRSSTERPITIVEGTNRLVGTDPYAVRSAALEVLVEPPAPRCPELWDGRAAERIADVIVNRMPSGRPTDQEETSSE